MFVDHVESSAVSRGLNKAVWGADGVNNVGMGGPRAVDADGKFSELVSLEVGAADSGVS